MLIAHTENMSHDYNPHVPSETCERNVPIYLSRASSNKRQADEQQEKGWIENCRQLSPIGHNLLRALLESYPATKKQCNTFSKPPRFVTST